MMVAEAGKVFGSSLDLDVVLDQVAKKTAQALGDCCQIRLLDESGEFLLPTATHHNDALRAQAFKDSVYGRPASVSGSLSGRALRTGEAILMARFDLAGSGLTDDRGYIAARAELSSLIIAPLIAAGTALGVLAVFRDVTEEPYDETDLQLCADLAERGAQAIYNVIDSRQADPQANVIEALRGLGYTDAAEHYVHFSYEMVALTPLRPGDGVLTVSGCR